MFTGLIEHMGVLARTAASARGVRLEVDPCGWSHRPGSGESIAINGCCLTIADDRALSGGALVFDVVPETLARTTLGALSVGSKVNLERSATPQTLLGGHIVQGHVDGIGRVESIRTAGEYRIRVFVPTSVLEFITPKGSIAVEGVSLTVAAVEVPAGPPGAGGCFEVALIPTTVAKTSLGGLKEGDAVNLETDIVGRTVIHWLRNFGPGGSKVG